MKIKTIFSTLLLGLIVTTTSCTKDNYDAPESTLMGRIVYKGEPLQLRGTSEAIQLQLYQDGYENMIRSVFLLVRMVCTLPNYLTVSINGN